MGKFLGVVGLAILALAIVDMGVAKAPLDKSITVAQVGKGKAPIGKGKGPPPPVVTKG